MKTHFNSTDEGKAFLKERARFIMDRTTGGDPQLVAASWLAETLFAEIRDKGGAPYYGHLERVADGVDAPLKPIAMLHDLLEDIPGWTAQDLRDIGFTAFVIAGVEAMSHGDDSPYFDDMVRLGQTPQAIPVKKSDLTDNSDTSRLGHAPTAKDQERLRKYALAFAYLDSIQSGNTAPGTKFGDWMRVQGPALQDFELLHKYSAAPFSSPAAKPTPAP